MKRTKSSHGILQVKMHMTIFFTYGGILLRQKSPIPLDRRQDQNIHSTTFIAHSKIQEEF